MCASAILNLLFCDDRETTASTSISLRENARCSVIQSKDDNSKRMNHVIKILVFQATISIVSYAYDKRECELLKGLSQNRGDKALHPCKANEFSCKIMVSVESFPVKC